MSFLDDPINVKEKLMVQPAIIQKKHTETTTKVGMILTIISEKVRLSHW